MSVPMFSIVVPVYNSEKYLDICINSILNQTYQDFELILVDDGSTDNSGEICDKFQISNPTKIKVIHQSNVGLPLARIIGFHEAEGLYIYNADNDDILDLNLLEKVKAAIDKSNADVIVFSATQIDIDGNQKDGYIRHLFSEGNVDLYDYWYKWVTTSGLNVLWLKVIKRELLNQQFEQEIKDYIHTNSAEDLLYSMPVIRNASSIYYLDQSLYYYRINPESISQNFQKNEYLLVSYEFSLFVNALKSLGFTDQAILEKFYNCQVQRLWHHIYRVVSTNRLTYSEKIDILKEIRSWELVHQLYTYLRSENIGVFCKIGLTIFYKSSGNNYSALFLFSKIYSILRKTKNLNRNITKKLWKH